MKLHEALATGKRCRRPGNKYWVTGPALGSRYQYAWVTYPASDDSGVMAYVGLTPAEADADDWYVEGDPSGIHSPFHRDMFGGIGGSYRWVNDGPPARCHPEAHTAVDTGMRWAFCGRCDTDLEFTSDGWIEQQRA